MILPIPLQCFLNGGTGFVVSSHARHWLVTCIHIVTGKVKNTTDASQFSGASLRVLGSDLVLPLVVDGKQAFIAVNDPGKDGRILDIMAIPLSDSNTTSFPDMDRTTLRQFVTLKWVKKCLLMGLLA